MAKLQMSETVLDDSDPRLRALNSDWDSKEVPEEQILELLQKMRTKMHEEGGVGLAAPQVGVNLRLFIVEVKGNPRYTGMPSLPFQAFINPVIEKFSQRTGLFEEGCLSVQDCRIQMRRPKAVTIRYLDQYLRPRRQRLKGVLARIVQHEFDHLEGILIKDYLPVEWQ